MREPRYNGNFTFPNDYRERIASIERARYVRRKVMIYLSALGVGLTLFLGVFLLQVLGVY